MCALKWYRYSFHTLNKKLFLSDSLQTMGNFFKDGSDSLVYQLSENNYIELISNWNDSVDFITSQRDCKYNIEKIDKNQI